MIVRLGVVLLALVAMALPVQAHEPEQVAQAAPAAPVREITKIAGEIYRFRNNFHYSIFVVTPAGIIATDPITRDAATWLKAELQRRFNLPVRYLVYSHDHADHISGGGGFADTAIVVSQERARGVVIGQMRPTAGPSKECSSSRSAATCE